MNDKDPDLSKYKDAEIPIVANIPTLLCLISQVQLATRHPGNNGTVRMIAEHFCRELQEVISTFAPDLNDIMEKGWNPDYDVHVNKY